MLMKIYEKREKDDTLFSVGRPYTPRGRNHGLSLFETAQKADGWFVQKLGVSETKAIPISAVDAERAAGMDEDTVLHKYLA